MRAELERKGGLSRAARQCYAARVRELDKDLVVVSTGDSDTMQDFTRALQLTYDVIVPAAH
jgi:hypothetical protein